MKKNIYLIILPLCFLILFNGKKYDEAVTKRLALTINLCLEGQDCGNSTMESQSMTTVPMEVEKVQLSQGSEHTIKMLNSGDGGQMIFEPAVIKVSVGDTIHFKATDAAHNSVSVDGMMPAGAASWASQLSQDISVTLDKEGVYVYQCDPHLIMAMVGVIQVGEAVNMEEIRSAASSYSANFLMNNDRLQGYLNQL